MIGWGDFREIADNAVTSSASDASASWDDQRTNGSSERSSENVLFLAEIIAAYQAAAADAASPTDNAVRSRCLVRGKWNVKGAAQLSASTLAGRNAL